MSRAMVGVVLVLSGCSFIMAKGPSTASPPQYYDRQCTDTPVTLVVDGVFFAGSVIAALAAPVVLSGKGDDAQNQMIIAGVIDAAIFGASGVYGYLKMSSCKSHHEEWASLHPDDPEGIRPAGLATPIYSAPPTPHTTPTTVEDGQEGGKCFKGVVCADGLTCASNRCVRPPEQVGAEGTSCKDNPCQSGLTCASNICVKLEEEGAEGTSCMPGNKCQPGLVCASKFCVKLPPPK